jgi:signal transduction histidine kinase
MRFIRENSSTQLEIQQATMQQIGRELHDNIGQKLTLVSLYVQQMLYENKAPEASERIDQVSQIINQSLQDLRSLSKTLTDDNINQKEIVTLIQEEVDNTNSFRNVLSVLSIILTSWILDLCIKIYCSELLRNLFRTV